MPLISRYIGRLRSAGRALAGRATRPQPRRAGRVSVEYTPRIDGDPDPGEVVWTWVPFQEDASQGKDRPVVVIGRRGSKLVGIPLTSKPDRREPQVAVGTGAWDPRRRPSYARIRRLLDIDPESMRREGSILDRERFDAVVAMVDDFYDVSYPEPPPPAPRVGNR